MSDRLSPCPPPRCPEFVVNHLEKTRPSPASWWHRIQQLRGPLHSSIMTHFLTLNLALSFRESDHLCTWSGSEYDCIGWWNRRQPEKREIPNKTCLKSLFYLHYILNFWLDFSHLRRPGIDVLMHRPWRSDWEDLLVGNGALSTASIQI